MSRNLSVIGVGNMAKAIIQGVIDSGISVNKIFLYDKYPECCSSYKEDDRFEIVSSIEDAVSKGDMILLSVKPQNYKEVLESIGNASSYKDKLYISIGAGITVDSVSSALDGAAVIRALPNLPMTIGKGVSALCRNDEINAEDFDFVRSVFMSAGSVVLIDECEMNRIIGVTSSSPAYVFKFIDAICKGASTQGLDENELLDAVCDVVIGSAMLLKSSSNTPKELISKVASKGGTTEQALLQLENGGFDNLIEKAMIACTSRADELGKQ